MKIKQVLVSVVIPNYAGITVIKDCLDSLFQEQGDLYEIIVVDDASEDGSIELMKKRYSKYTNFKLIELKKNLGPVNATNIGVKESQGIYIFRLGNDTVIIPGWSQKIVNFFNKNLQVAVAQTKMLKKGSNKYDYAGDYIGPFGFLIERARSADDRGQFDKIIPIFSVKGDAMIFRKDVFLLLGGEDSTYHFGWEEPDFTWRAWLAGYETCFYPFITVYHAYGTGIKSADYYKKAGIHYHGCKNNIASLIKNLSSRSLLTILPINISCYIALSLMFFIKLDFFRGFSLIRGVGWNIKHLPETLQKRRHIQRNRKISDKELFFRVGASRNILYYLEKGVTYILGRPF